MRHTPPTTEALMTARRRRVAELRRDGYTSKTEIAQILGVTRPTIYKDWAVIDEWWREQSIQDIAIAKGRQAIILNDLLRGVLPQALNPDQDGQLSYVDRAQSILKQEADLFGLNAPTKVAPTDPSGSHEYGLLSDDERLRRVVAILGIEAGTASEAACIDAIPLRISGPDDR